MSLFQTSKGRVFQCRRLKPFPAFEVNAGIHFPTVKFNPTGHKGRAHFSSNTGQVEFSQWRKLNSRDLGITRSMISVSSSKVLRKLRGAGHEAYLVGGCVRDLLLNKVPKDFDVITTASLRQVKRMFQRAIIIGRRFPICKVFVEDSAVEVSSFETAAEQSERKLVSTVKMWRSGDPSDYIRWKNCMCRDFTVNSLFFDPSQNVIFDYTNAMSDLRSLQLRTVIPAHLSFKEDQARILRGLRLAARLNLSFAKETETALSDLSLSVTELSKVRICLEMSYMLAYGAAERSLLLLKRFKLLEILLPFHAAYLSEEMDHELGLRSSMLMKLFSNLDKLIGCDRPCNDSLWVAILVFQLALFGNPQPAVVVLTFASLLHLGTWEDSVKFSRGNSPATRTFMPEILDSVNNLSDDEIAECVIQLARQVVKSIDVLISMDSLSEAMARFPEFPHSGLVFVSQKMGLRARTIFRILMENVTSLKMERRCPKIDYSLLSGGDVCEIRFVLGKIILNSVLSGATSDTRSTKVNNNAIQGMNPFQKFLESTHLNKDDSTGNRQGVCETRFVLLKSVLSGATSDTRSTKVDNNAVGGINPFQKSEFLESTHLNKDDSRGKNGDRRKMLPYENGCHERMLVRQLSLGRAGPSVDADRLRRKRGSANSDSCSHGMAQEKVDESLESISRRKRPSLAGLFMRPVNCD